MSEFATLLEELAALPTLAKSEPAAAAQQAAPVEGAEEAGEAAGGEAAPEAGAEGEAAPAAAEEGAEGEAAEAAEAEPVVAKAMRVTLPDGTEAEGYDATATIEALQAELDGTKADLAKALAAVDEQGRVLGVSAGLVKSLHGVVLDHGATIESMRGEIAALGKQGSGRKGVVLAKAAPAAAPAASRGEQPYPDVMAKALALQSEGKISGADVNRVVAFVGRGLGVPEDLAPKFAA